GTNNVTLGAQGALSVSLAPNAGATPAATYYTVVYQLSDTVKTEFWTVGTTSPTTIAAVRTTLGTGSAAQMASRQYVDSVVGSKATDTAVVHKKRRRNEKASFGSPFDGDQRRLHSQIIWAGSQRGNG